MQLFLTAVIHYLLSQGVPDSYTLQDAQTAYGELKTEISEMGPATIRSFWAKAYGILNCGAAGFEIMPTYNDSAHVMHRTIFMNNYGYVNSHRCNPRMLLGLTNNGAR